MHFPPKFLQKRFPLPMVHLLHRLYGVDALVGLGLRNYWPNAQRVWSSEFRYCRPDDVELTANTSPSSCELHRCIWMIVF